MTDMKHLLHAFKEPKLARQLLEEIHNSCSTPITIMEVCGTHTMSIFKHGIKSLLPKEITLLSGPGCPVCVTAQGEIDAVMTLAKKPGVIMATFGDLMRVPGRGGTLAGLRGQGADIRMVYSPMDAVALAQRNPDREVVFAGIGFETTAPTTALAIMDAKDKGLANFSLFSLHKLTPPALSAVLDQEGHAVKGLILPGHVCVIIGEEGFQRVVKKQKIPAAIAGFEPADILGAVLSIIKSDGKGHIENLYGRAVEPRGNLKALEILNRVFEVGEAGWRGVGMIEQSGLIIRDEFSTHDALKRFNVRIETESAPTACRCGEILTARMVPAQCPMFGTACTPSAPVGPCMVSSEGSCAAAYKYGDQHEAC